VTLLLEEARQSLDDGEALDIDCASGHLHTLSQFK
jgi:hypothetical protein